MVLDGGDEVYLWIGKGSTDEEKEKSLQMAKVDKTLKFFLLNIGLKLKLLVYRNTCVQTQLNAQKIPRQLFIFTKEVNLAVSSACSLLGATFTGRQEDTNTESD
jgi:hypothetical protein